MTGLPWWRCNARQLFNRILCRLSGRYERRLTARLRGEIDKEVERRTWVRESELTPEGLDALDDEEIPDADAD